MIGICRSSCDPRYGLRMMCLKGLIIRDGYGPGEDGYPTMVVENAWGG